MVSFNPLPSYVNQLVLQFTAVRFAVNRQADRTALAPVTIKLQN